MDPQTVLTISFIVYSTGMLACVRAFPTARLVSLATKESE